MAANATNANCNALKADFVCRHDRCCRKRNYGKWCHRCAPTSQSFEESLASLIKLIQRDCDGGAGLIMPFLSQEYIQAMLFWTHCQPSLGLPYDAEMFNRPDAIYSMESRRGQEEADDAAKNLIKAPKIFKKDSDWHLWSKNLLTYSRSKQGKNNTAPLA
jgi:hypothetical protein